MASNLEIEIATLKEKFAFISTIFDRFDNTLEKIEEMIEARRYENSEEIKNAHARIEASEQRILAEMKNLRNDMNDQHETLQSKINVIDRWRWILIGGGGVVGFLLNLLFSH